MWGGITYRCGPRVSLLLGGALMGTSQMSMYLLATKHLTPPPFVSLPTSLVLAAIGCFIGLQIVSSAAFTAPVQHCPQNRGLVASIVKCFVGLGGAVTTQGYVLVWGTPTGDATALNALLLWASISVGVNVFAALIMPAAASPHDHAEPKRVLDSLFGLLTVLGLFATTVSLVPTGSLAYRGLVGGLFALALAPILLVLTAPDNHPTPATAAAAEQPPPPGTATRSGRAIAPQPVASSAPATLLTRQKSSFESPVAYDLGGMLRTPDAWLFLFCGAVLLGSGNVSAPSLSPPVSSSCLSSLPVGPKAPLRRADCGCACGGDGGGGR